MNTPKPHSRPWHKKSEWKPPHQKRKHLNKKFYNSKAWRDTRKSYLMSLQRRVWESAKAHVWNLEQSELEIEPHQAMYLLTLDYIPCEQCMKLFAVGQYKAVREGKELDHIEPLNPENALDSKSWGDPFNHDNLQLLCRRHHSIKSNRDKAIIKLK